MQPVIAAIIGLILGDLAALFLDRAYREEPVIGAPHRCPRCRATPTPLQYIPLLNYALTSGRCPACHERLPLRTWILPLGGAVLFAVSTLVFDDLGAGLLAGFFALIFLSLSVTDIERRLLTNRIVYPATLLAISVCWAWPDSDVIQIIGGGLVAIVVAIALLAGSLVFGRGAFGMGDSKMIVLIGFVVGLPSVIVAVFLGTIIAAVASAFLLITRISKPGAYMAHGPFLAIGAIIGLWWGQDIWDAYRG
jgi:prepilin signal peptidase PulO-like enzyme (type II secretory pathway)